MAGGDVGIAVTHVSRLVHLVRPGEKLVALDLRDGLVPAFVFTGHFHVWEFFGVGQPGRFEPVLLADAQELHPVERYFAAVAGDREQVAPGPGHHLHFDVPETVAKVALALVPDHAPDRHWHDRMYLAVVEPAEPARAGLGHQRLGIGKRGVLSHRLLGFGEPSLDFAEALLPDRATERRVGVVYVHPVGQWLQLRLEAEPVTRDPFLDDAAGPGLPQDALGDVDSLLLDMASEIEAHRAAALCRFLVPADRPGRGNGIRRHIPCLRPPRGRLSVRTRPRP